MFPENSKISFVQAAVEAARMLRPGGENCRVDGERKIVQETACYIDMTLPSAPDKSQIPFLNKIYECGLPFDSMAPHSKAIELETGRNTS
ncbi:MAG: hypothetical protein KIS76_11540 [Pyrinomonadaceae bacterium]|nr:hypothetical protein [Pyrinomonadaceae bacterium]